MHKLNHRFGNDGAFWISYDDLLKKYQTFDRTRLFSPEWKITQQWTSLEVPWTVDYHSTKFSFTIQKTAPVVIVLSQVSSFLCYSKIMPILTLWQLDDRYFKGLEGQYRFSLSFRVHKSGEDDYIVRSHGNYTMSRSVTAELELEQGDYDVLLKVEAIRNQDLPTVEQMVRDNAKDRRDKLLRIGLAYDLAHAKGKIVETDEEKKQKKAEEAKKTEKERKAVKDKLMKEKQKRKHNENKEKRKLLQAKEKRKAKKAAKAAKLREAEEKANAESGNGDVKKEEAKTESKETDDATKVAEGPATSEEVPKEKDASGETSSTAAVEAPAAVESDPASTKQAQETAEAADSKVTDKEPTDKPAEEAQPTVSEDANPAAPENVAEDDESDYDSDINSEISDISDGVIDDEIEATKLDEAAQNPPPAPTEEEPDEFERDPWNAIIVVGLRVYSKNSDVTVRIVRPNTWEDGKSGLDVDDPAADATKGTAVATPAIKIDQPEETAAKEEGKTESEGSGVLV